MNKTINYKGKKVYYRISGHGSPVVLLHGFGEDGDIWQQQVEFLQKSFSVIIPDLPGSGRSELTDDMSIDGMAEVIKSVIENENIASCPVIGHSMGGYITLALAEKYPHLLTAFGLFHSTSYADSEEKKETRKKAIEFIGKHGGYEFLKTAIPNLFAEKSRIEIPGVVNALTEKGKAFSANALIAYYEAMIARPDRTAVLASANKPVLFVIGEYDGAVSPEDSLKQSHLATISSVHILYNSGHMGMLEETEKANNILKGFLNFVQDFATTKTQ